MRSAAEEKLLNHRSGTDLAQISAAQAAKYIKVGFCLNVRPKQSAKENQMCTSVQPVETPLVRLRSALTVGDPAQILLAADLLHNGIHWAGEDGETPRWLRELMREAPLLAPQLGAGIKERGCPKDRFAAPSGCGASLVQRHPCRRLAHLLWHLGDAGAGVLAELGLKPKDVRECVYQVRLEGRSRRDQASDDDWFRL